MGYGGVVFRRTGRNGYPAPGLSCPGEGGGESYRNYVVSIGIQFVFIKWALSHEGNAAVYGDYLGVLTDHFHYINVGIRRGGMAIEGAVPAHILRIGREILPLEDHLSPAGE